MQLQIIPISKALKSVVESQGARSVEAVDIHRKKRK
jgi:hypothetical protein